jgi:hypothetical protein
VLLPERLIPCGVDVTWGNVMLGGVTLFLRKMLRIRQFKIVFILLANIEVFFLIQAAVIALQLTLLSEV